MWVAEEGPGSGKGGGGFYWEDQPEVEVQLAGGSAYGVQQVRDEIGNILDNLDLLADNIRNEVNELHYTGIGSDGNTGRYFFRHDLSGALSLSVEQTIVDSPEQIAASAVTATGDNSLAHDIFNLQFEKVFRGGTADYNDFYQSIVTDVGAKVANAETKKEGAEAVLEQTKNWQQHYTGVNLDEEMAEMIQVQHAFTAASKVASVIDEMLNRISNGIGA
jgi:flagellar hook-associated protein 1 FlgK